MTTCTVPPEGWTCSRPAGHPGPCAASAATDQPVAVRAVFGKLEFRACCDSPDCTACAGRGGFYRKIAGPHYTCKGKGGEYALIGVAYGAGSSRGAIMNIYRDVATGVLYFRTPDDFDNRMQKLGDPS